MNTMIALSRSTVLADSRSRRTQAHAPAPVVRVGGISMGSRTMVGNAAGTINRAYSRIGVRVGAGEVMPAIPNGTYGGTATSPAGSVAVSTTPSATMTPAASSGSGGITGAIGKTAGWALLATMVAGPPAVGYLIGGKIGLAVGAIVAAPMVIMFAASLYNALPGTSSSANA